MRRRVGEALLFVGLAFGCRGARSPSDSVAGPDASLVADAGTSLRATCVSRFGDGLTESFGRLDGRLVSVVPPRESGSCNADRRHVHLQVLVHGSVYDVAVNVGEPDRPDVRLRRHDTDALGGGFEEGWHPTGALDYSSLGVRSADFSPASDTARVLEEELATADRVSVWATGYGPGGVHLVHRNGDGTDGAILLSPLGTRSRVLLFRFEDQEF